MSNRTPPHGRIGTVDGERRTSGQRSRRARTYQTGRFAVRRRSVLRTAGALVTTGALAGCLGGTGGDATPEGDDGDDEKDPSLDVGGLHLSSSFPVELVEPDVVDDSGHVFNEGLVANVHWHGDFSHWHFGPLLVSLEERRRVRTRFVDEDLETVPLDGDPFSQRVRPTGDSPADLVEIDVDGALVEFAGAAVGSLSVVVELRCDGDVRWASPPLPIEIVD